MEQGFRLSAVGCRSIVLVAMLLMVFLRQHAAAQVLEEKSAAEARIKFGPPDTIRMQIGAEVKATRGACRNIVAYVAVPFDCPEQSVELVSEDFSPEVAQVDYRVLQNGAKQMVISVPRLASGATAKALVTFDVTTRPILPPEETDDLVIPKRIPRAVRAFTNGSPYIEVKQPKIKALAKEVLADVPEDATDWQKVETIYDYVLDHIKYVEGVDKGAIDTLRDGQADCQGRSMLFIALCRANKIPARVVWVDGHVYAEFYLEDAEGNGYWFPVESAGSRSFGEMPLARTILQKGDNFRAPERPTERLRYASDYLIALPAKQGGGPPKYKFIRQQVPR